MEHGKYMKEYFLIYAICFSILMSGSMIAFLFGVATNKDADFVVALVLFFMGLLLTMAWARTSIAARWLLSCLLGLTLFMGIQYLWFLYRGNSEAKRLLELVKEKNRIAPVQQVIDAMKPSDETVKPKEND